MTQPPEADDWEPLSNEQLFADDRSLPASPPPLVAKPLPPKPRVAKLPHPVLPPVTPAASAVRANPDAEQRALHELKQRLATAKKRMAPLHAAFASATRRLAYEPPLPVEAATKADAPDDDRSLGIEFEDGHDPREDQSWFRALPATEQQRLGTAWRAQKNQYSGERAQFCYDVRYAAICGAGVFVFVAILTAIACADGGRSLQLVVAGAFAAAIARVLRGGRFVFAIAGFATYALVMQDALLKSQLLWYVWSVAGFATALIGIDREMRQAGGFGGRCLVSTKPTEPAIAAGSQSHRASDSSTSTPHEEKNALTPSGATAIGRNEKNNRS